LEEGFLVDEAAEDGFFLALGGYDRTRDRSFSVLPRVRLKGLFLCLPCTVAFVVSFPVAVIDSHC